MKRIGNRAGRLAQSLKLGTAIASALLVCAGPTEAEAMVQERTAAVRLDIPPQDLGAALATFARATGQELLYSPELVAGRRSSRVSGRFSPRDGLRHLLAGSGIGFVASPGGAFLLSDAGMTQNGRVSPGSGEARGGGEMAGGASGSEANGASSMGGMASEDAGVDIIVTAQKREEILREVPVPITVVRGEALADSGLLRLQDYYTRIPGMTFTAGAQSTQILTLRGISTGSGNPTVGVTVDDVPFGSPFGSTGGFQVPDVDPGDLARIEVLRGPQGTLYGASSMGGLLKFVTLAPDLQEISGRVQGGLSTVRHGDELGYSARGAINLPLGETVAVRASAFRRRDPGYYDNVQAGDDDVNSVTAEGARFSLLWRPSQDFSARFGVVLQALRGDGAAEADVLPGLGQLEQRRTPGSGWFDRRLQVYSAVLDGRVGAVELTSVTAYTVSDVDETWDISNLFAGPVSGQFPGNVANILNVTRNERFTQEIRATIPIGSRVRWLIGGFYANENSEFGQSVLATSPANGAVAGTFYSFLRPYDYTDKAVFTNLTVQVTDTFDVQLGGRYSRFWQAQGPTPSLGFPPLGTGSAVSTPRVIGEPDDAFTYLVTPRWRPTDNLMLYARFASGYRPGVGGSGSPSDPCRVNNYPCQYGPDQTRNYEIGAKGRTPGGLLSFDVSLFYIDWQDMQVTVLHAPSGRTFVSNASRARSRGVEAAFELRPSEGLTIAASGAFTDAELTEPLPTGSPSLPVGGEGDRLPLSAPFSASVAVDQAFHLGDDVSASVGATFSHVGERPGVFTAASSPRLYYPGYNRLDLRASVRHGHWEISAFVNNLTDERGVLARGTIPTLNVTYVPPRTAGVLLSYTY